jgi:ribulose-5-phosphate 4-epimerase/fuculose-1-phosphate aldolase
MTVILTNEQADSRPGAQTWTEEERQARIDLAAAYRLVHLYGWDDLIFTHISSRVPGSPGHFLINPFGMLFEEITASSLVKIDLDGNVVEPTSFGVNYAGFTIHSAIHAAREDVACVLHLHTTAGVAVSCHRDGLLPISQSALSVMTEVTYHDYEGLALNLDERPRLVKNLGSKNAMILRNHGTLTAGSSVAQAFLMIYLLERACEMQVAALSGNQPLISPPDAVQGLVTKQMQEHSAAQIADRLVWPALLRKLDRMDPGYRN